MSTPLARSTDAGHATLTNFDRDHRAAKVLADRPLESADIIAITNKALSLTQTRNLLFPDALGLLERCIVALLGGHLILQGPPGTGKTTLATILAEAFNATHQVETATADWSTYDVIGGLHPTGGKLTETLRPWLGHVPRAAVRCANVIAQQADSSLPETHQAHWLILDEFNRAEVDKAIGPLYTALGGGERRLPLWYADVPERSEVWIPDRFRLIGTMNTVDTNYVYSFSQGLSRRFQFTYIGVPTKEQIPAELAAARRQAGEWYARTYQHADDTAADKAAAATAFEANSALASVNELLDKLLHAVRYDTEDVPGWPLGTAQIVDLYRQLALRLPYIESTSVMDGLDRALADQTIPQAYNLRRNQLDALDAWLTDQQLPRAGQALRHLRSASATGYS